MMKHFPLTFLRRAILIFSAVAIALLPTASIHAVSNYDKHAVSRDTSLFDSRSYANCPTDPGGGELPGSGKENIPKIWDYMLKKTLPFKLEPYQIAGVMGNMQSESGFDPTIIQGGGNSPDPSAAGNLGYGLVQWTPGSKLSDILNGKASPTIESEIDALYAQLAGFEPHAEGLAGKKLLASTDIASATLAFEVGYERHKGPPQPDRITQAKIIFNQYAAGAPSTGPGNGILPAPVAGDITGAECATGGISGGCEGGTTILTVPAGGQGVNICYFNQAALSGGGFSWGGCGCLPTSTLMIRATMEGNPGLDHVSVLNGIRASGGVAGDGCAGVIGKTLNYFSSQGYQVQELLKWKGTNSSAILANVKQALGEGKLVLAHTSTSVDSAGIHASDGHYLVVHAVDANGNFNVANPGDKDDNKKAISPARMEAWLDGFWAIKK